MPINSFFSDILTLLDESALVPLYYKSLVVAESGPERIVTPDPDSTPIDRLFSGISIEYHSADQ